MSEEQLQEQANPPVNGSYEISLGEDGVQLIVKPPQNGGDPVNEAAIVKDLKSRDVNDFSYSAVVNAVKEASGITVKIAEKVEQVEPEFEIIVDRDRMEASLQVIIPKNCRPITIEDVRDKIHEAGIVHGIDQDAVQKAFDRPGTRVSCAKGNAAVDGNDAHIEYTYDLTKKGRPVQLEDGRVDFKDLNLYTVVAIGDVLAEKIPATAGTPGTDVLGQPVYGRAGKDIMIPAGKNVTITDNKVIAAIAGQMQIINNKIHVLPVIEIKGDVDLSTGNIEFVGNVVVRGSVQTGFSVKADGNVEISGSVSGGTVEGKNVLIRMGIQGMQRGYVKAKENVATKFIENATVMSEGDVMVTDTILHSRVSAGKRVIVEGKRGFIAGGHIMAAEEIRAKVVGTHLAVATDLEVGIDPVVRDEYQTLKKDLKKAESTLDQAQKAVNILRAVNQSDLSPEKRDMLLRLTKSQFNLTGQVENMRKRIMEIELLFEEIRYGRIRVADIVYPGVKIIIGTLVRPIRENAKYVSYYLEDGEIKAGSFR